MNRLFRKIFDHARLLVTDPEAFGRNLSQFTNPALFDQRLRDIMNAAPMHVRLRSDLATPPRLNILSGEWSESGMTGGPNTAINLACRVARLGIATRLVATAKPSTVEPAWLRTHARHLLGGDEFPEISIMSACHADAPLEIGPRDVFMATHWTTAQQLKPVLPTLPIKKFFYLIQDFEPGFYAWSSNHALAAETYGLHYWPIINESTLANYLDEQRVGRFADPKTRAEALVFEPAVDEASFHAARPLAAGRPRRLLFYARPSNARNLFGLGLTALQRAAAEPAFDDWEFMTIGGRGGVPVLPLGDGRAIRPGPWRDYAGYGQLLREADILLCPMLSPHTSYPVLEMAASGGVSVTNAFATKTEEALRRISPNIIPVEPTVEGFAAGLSRAALAVNAGVSGTGEIAMPRNWGDALDPVAAKIAAIISNLKFDANREDAQAAARNTVPV